MKQKTVLCEPCLPEKKKKRQPKCKCTEHKLKIEDQSKLPSSMHLTILLSRQKKAAECLNAEEQLIIDGVKCDKTMLLINKD